MQARPATSASSTAIATPDPPTARGSTPFGQRLAKPLYRSPDGKVEIRRIALADSESPLFGVAPMTLRANTRLVIEGRGLATYANGWLLGSGTVRGKPVHPGSALQSERQEDGRLVLRITSIAGGKQPWPSQVGLVSHASPAGTVTEPPTLRLRLILGGGAYVTEVPLPRSTYACRPLETNCR